MLWRGFRATLICHHLIKYNKIFDHMQVIYSTKYGGIHSHILIFNYTKETNQPDNVIIIRSKPRYIAMLLEVMVSHTATFYR